MQGYGGVPAGSRSRDTSCEKLEPVAGVEHDRGSCPILLPAGAGERRELLARLRAVVEAKDAEVAMLRAELTAERELRRRMELRIAELERRLGQDSTNSGTPTSKESIGARERRKAEREKRDSSERERRKDRKPGGQPGHPGAGLARDPDPEERKTAEPPAQCSLCGAGLAGAQPAGASWAQVWDVSISRLVTARSLLSRRWPRDRDRPRPVGHGADRRRLCRVPGESAAGIQVPGAARRVGREK